LTQISRLNSSAKSIHESFPVNIENSKTTVIYLGGGYFNNFILIITRHIFAPLTLCVISIS